MVEERRFDERFKRGSEGGGLGRNRNTGEWRRTGMGEIYDKDTIKNEAE